METVTWTDDKIDAGFARLAARMDLEAVRNEERFKGVDQRFVGVDQRFVSVDQRFDAVDAQLADLKAGQAQMVDKFDALNRTLLQIGGGMIGTLIAGIIALLVTQ
jgi:hypothetical protein